MPGLGRFCQRGAPARRPQAKQSELWTLCPDVPREEAAGQTAPSRQPRAKSFGEARTRGTGLCSGKAWSILRRWQHRGARRRPEATAVPAQVPRTWPASLHGPPIPHRGGWLCQNMQVALNGARHLDWAAPSASPVTQDRAWVRSHLRLPGCLRGSLPESPGHWAGPSTAHRAETDLVWTGETGVEEQYPRTAASSCPDILQARGQGSLLLITTTPV